MAFLLYTICVPDCTLYSKIWYTHICITEQSCTNHVSVFLCNHSQEISHCIFLTWKVIIFEILIMFLGYLRWQKCLASDFLRCFLSYTAHMPDFSYSTLCSHFWYPQVIMTLKYHNSQIPNAYHNFQHIAAVNRTKKNPLCLVWQG